VAASRLKFFATELCKERLRLSPKLRGRLLKECYQLREVDREGRDWSKANYPWGYTSYSSASDLPERSSNFGLLREAINPVVASFVQRLGLRFPTGRLVMSSCWVNVMGQHASHAFHLHPLSVVSGTYYLKIPGGAPGFRIEDPRIAAFMASPAREAYVTLKPREGEVLLFESWLKHEVPPNRERADRVSVSFNYDWVER